MSNFLKKLIQNTAFFSPGADDEYFSYAILFLSVLTIFLSVYFQFTAVLNMINFILKFEFTDFNITWEVKSESGEWIN